MRHPPTLKLLSRSRLARMLVLLRGTAVAQGLHCWLGHRWEPELKPHARPPDLGSSCPVCGRPPFPPGGLNLWFSLLLAAAAALLALMLGLSLDNDPRGWELLVLVGFMGAMISLLALSLWLQSKQTPKVAKGLHLSYTPQVTVDALKAFAPFRLFDPLDAGDVFLGAKRRATDALFGRIGDCDVIFFYYINRVSSFLTSAVLLPDGAAGLPDFRFAPRFSDYVHEPTYAPVELADPGKVAVHYKAWGSDAAAVRDCLRPELLQWIGRQAAWYGESMNGHLLVYWHSTLAPHQCADMLADAIRFRDLLHHAEEGKGGETPPLRQP